MQYVLTRSIRISFPLTLVKKPKRRRAGGARGPCVYTCMDSARFRRIYQLRNSMVIDAMVDKRWLTA